MARPPIERKVDKLEEALIELAQQSRVTEMKLASFIQEMRDYREENDRMIQEMKEDTRLFKERTEKTIQEMKEENSRMIQEMKEDTRLFKERTDKTIQEMKEENSRMIQEMKEDTRLFKERTDKTIQEMKENTRMFEERMERTIKDMNRKWGELANKMGTVTEDIVAPGFPFLIERYFGLSLDDISCRRKVKDKSGNRWEFDLVARSGNIAFIVDVKSDYNRVEYLDHFTQLVLPKAAELLPELGGCKIIGCIASFRLDPSIIEKASEMGILAISLGGDYLEFCNQEVVETIKQTIGGN